MGPVCKYSAGGGPVEMIAQLMRPPRVGELSALTAFQAAAYMRALRLSMLRR